MKYIHYITFVTQSNPQAEQITNFTSKDLVPTMESALRAIGKIIPLDTSNTIGIKNLSTFKT